MLKNKHLDPPQVEKLGRVLKWSARWFIPIALTESTSIRIIAGLGNPGSKYDQTRHNAGFWFVDELAKRYEVSFRHERKVLGDVCRIAHAGHELWLLKPSTFMNRSGQSLLAISGYFKVPPTQILVVHDEIDLPSGVARLKRTGGHGGHNGLRDIIAHLGKDFWRLRLGVGHPGHRDQVIDYVLSRPSAADVQAIHQRIEKTAELITRFIRGEMEQAMHWLHSNTTQQQSN